MKAERNKTIIGDTKEYTESWISLVVPLLKENATIYVCCDWQSGQAICKVLKKYFYVQNRISWQREKGRGAFTNWKNGMKDIWFATNSKTYTFNVEDDAMIASGIKYALETEGYEVTHATKIKDALDAIRNTDLFDFVIKTDKMIYGIETNFYGGVGSKLNETARSYKMLSQEADTIDGFTFVWFIDGIGWKSSRGNLRVN